MVFENDSRYLVLLQNIFRNNMFEVYYCSWLFLEMNLERTREKLTKEKSIKSCQREYIEFSILIESKKNHSYLFVVRYLSVRCVYRLSFRSMLHIVSSYPCDATSVYMCCPLQRTLCVSRSICVFAHFSCSLASSSLLVQLNLTQCPKYACSSYRRHKACNDAHCVYLLLYFICSFHNINFLEFKCDAWNLNALFYVHHNFCVKNER